MAAAATRVTALACAACLMGCAAHGELPVPATLLSASALELHGDVATTAIDEAWWQAFGDVDLDALVQRALRDHPSLLAAAARVATADAAAARVDASARPMITGRLDATHQRFSENALVPPPIAGSVKDNATLQAGLGWEIDFFGRHRASLLAALGTAGAARAEARGARVLLAASVVRQYVQLARSCAQRGLAERSLAQRAEVLDLVRHRVQAGIDTSVELRQGEGALPQARQSIDTLDEQIASRRHALAALTVQPPSGLDMLAPRLDRLQRVPLPAHVPADLLGRRADIDAARLRVQAAAQSLKAARAEFYPSVNLVAFAGASALGLDRLLDTGSRQAGIGPAISLPLFDAGRLRANEAGRAAELDAAIAVYNAAVLEAVREAVDQVDTLRFVERQQTEQAQAAAAAESAYRLARQRYRAGLGSYLVVLSAESDVLARRRSGIDLVARDLEAQADLMRALGGGYNAPGSTE
jgi:NodT family efflux transporter outer membrane factor (OMF) lipoprotein